MQWEDSPKANFATFDRLPHSDEIATHSGGTPDAGMSSPLNQGFG